MFLSAFKHLLFVFLFFCSSFVWADGRKEAMDQYLHDFVGQAFPQSYPSIYQAIKNAVEHLPQEAFEKINHADLPVLFLEMPHFGGGKWANSNAIIVEPDDPPTFKDGLWIIKLSTQLEDSKDIDAIEGIVLHELAHFILGHQGGAYDIQKEKDANNLVKKWGHESKFLKAKAKFGSHTYK